MTTIQAGGLHYAEVRRDAAQSITNGAYVAVQMDTTVRSSGITVDLTATADNGLTIARTGWYQAAGGAGFSANDAGAGISINGTLTQPVAVGETIQGAGRAWVSAPMYLTAGDVVRLMIGHSNAGSVNTLTAANARPVLTLVEIR